MTGIFLKLLVIAAAIGVGVIVYPQVSSDQPSRPKAEFDPARPESIVSEVQSENARAAATFDAGELRLEYSIMPWALTTGTARRQYYSHAKRLIPIAFRSPKVAVFCNVITATFKDIRGHEAESRAAELCFTRASAARVNWENVDFDNLPRIADRAWIHPGFAK